MKHPKSKAGRRVRFCYWAFELYKNPWVQYLVAPILLTLPPLVVTKFEEDPVIRNVVGTVSPRLAEFLTAHHILLFIFGTFYSLLVLSFAKWIVKNVENRGVNVEGLLSLVAAMDGVVGAKQKRFAGHVGNVGALTKETAFCAITQPEIQISEILRGICDLFNAARTSKRDQLIRVTFAEIEGGKIQSIPIFYPQDEPVTSSIQALNDSSSAILTAVRTKRMVVIDSIAAELKKGRGRRFVDTGNADDNVGSLICYPVITPTREVPFVISIHCDEDRYFKNEFAELYEHTLKRFALRLNLEYSLLLIKEELCGRTT